MVATLKSPSAAQMQQSILLMGEAGALIGERFVNVRYAPTHFRHKHPQIALNQHCSIYLQRKSDRFRNIMGVSLKHLTAYRDLKWQMERKLPED